MVQTENANWLVLLFEAQLYATYARREPQEVFSALDRVYRRQAGEEPKATFDRLVDSDGNLLGVQVWPVMSVAGDLLGRLPRVAYLAFPDQVPCVQVYFTRRPVGEVESGGEQALGLEVYETAAGRLGMSFPLADFLESPIELERISTGDLKFIEFG